MKNDEDGDIQLEYRREVPHNAGRPSSRSRLSKDVIEQAWHTNTYANRDVQLEYRRELAHNEGPRRHAVQAKNDEGAAVKLGTAAGFTSKYYCARVLGPNAIPGSNGRCGPTNGPQCPSCKRFQSGRPACGHAKNDEGAAVKTGTAAGFTSTFYCGRHLGRGAIPGSNGRCGPSNGPQCASCKRFQP